jgi:hypothetical protein
VGYDAGFIPGNQLASLTITNADVEGSTCGYGVHLYRSSATTPPNLLLFMVDAPTWSWTLQRPPEAQLPLLVAMVEVSSLSPGVYRSTDGPACGEMSFEYFLPAPADLRCDGGTPPFPSGCPPGCGIVIPGGAPCAPLPPVVTFQQHGPSNCLGDTTPVEGSWTLTLSSITQVAPDRWLPRGAFDATLARLDGGAPLSVSLLF